MSGTSFNPPPSNHTSLLKTLMFQTETVCGLVLRKNVTQESDKDLMEKEKMELANMRLHELLDTMHCLSFQTESSSMRYHFFQCIYTIKLHLLILDIKNIRTDSYYHASVVPENAHLVKICIPSFPLSLCRIQC